MNAGLRLVKSKGTQTDQRNFTVHRIRHPSKRSSHLSLWLGLVAAIAVVAGFLHYSSIQAEKKKAGNYNYLKPVPSESVLKSKLTEDQYRVARQNGTETAFRNEYWDNNRPGIYVDVITNDPLFSSLDKFDGGTGRRHLFKDPTSPTGERYAVNSAAMRFVPVEKMEAEGYTEYLHPFEKKRVT